MSKTMSATPKSDKVINDCDSGTTTPYSITGSSGHKPSLRGTKLAKRARSFKDDFLEKISQIRTPTNTMVMRSHSPNSPRPNSKGQNHGKNHGDEVIKPVQDLKYHVRQVKHALTHFKDVISKKKLEMLSGNGTVVLESISNVHTALQKFTINEESNSMKSATTQVYLNLGKLIKLCDEVILSDDAQNCACLNEENVKEIVDLVDDAVENLVKLANEKLAEREQSMVTLTSNSKSSNMLQRPIIDVAGQRTSLPDIPLTPRERDILEKTSQVPVRTSHSTESILRDSSPPPKPPLPINRSTEPPPIPPKRKSQHSKNNSFHDQELFSDSSFLGIDQMSLNSRSPDDNRSNWSDSAGSLDSALNHSREEDELRTLTLFDTNGEDSSMLSLSNDLGMTVQDSREDSDKYSTNQLYLSKFLSDKSMMHRNSNESGFGSARSSDPIVAVNQQQQSSVFSIQQQQKLHITSTQTTTKTSNFQLNEPISLENLASLHQISAMTSQNSTFSMNQNVVVREETKTNCQKNLGSLFMAQQTSMERSVGSMATVSYDNVDDVFAGPDERGSREKPPALPVKQRPKSFKRGSHYDNVDEALLRLSPCGTPKDPLSPIGSHITRMITQKQQSTRHQSLMDPITPFHPDSNEDTEPPSLPPKKKHIRAYMEMFGNTSQRHSMATYSLSQTSNHIAVQNTNTIIHSQTMSLSPAMYNSIQSPPLSPNSLPNNNAGIKPPAIPPKTRLSSSRNPSIITTPPSSPKVFPSEKPHLNNIPIIATQPAATNIKVSPVPSNDDSLNRTTLTNNLNSTHNKALCTKNIINNSIIINHSSNNSNNNNNNNNNNGNNNNNHGDDGDKLNYVLLADTVTGTMGHKKQISSISTNIDDEEVVLRNNPARAVEKNGYVMSVSPTGSTTASLPNLIEEIDVSKYLVKKKEGEEGPEVKGGLPDALIIHATKAQKMSDAFGEAFITTFRTFILPLDLIEKLVYRYQQFVYQTTSDPKQKAAKESFSLLVRVVNDLTAPDLTPNLLSILMNFNYELVCNGQLILAKTLRIKILEKVIVYKSKFIPMQPISSRAVTTNQPTLLDLKSLDVAEQMTLLDADLFQKIEIPEVLIWAKEQCEERSPNLKLFTEHFNKMSYWARSQILKQEDAKDREKYVLKFIKIMKNLRKINNFNSYLALLSALLSAAITRLEWQKSITEALKEYSALIDSSSSFRAYRQVLAETNPPCIPYIGLVLQDLTFVHEGNPDLLVDSYINFTKRWQQYNIVVNMKRFRKETYLYKKNDRIIYFFDNFEDHLPEDAMWALSEKYKPRGQRKTHG